MKMNDEMMEKVAGGLGPHPGDGSPTSTSVVIPLIRGMHPGEGTPVEGKPEDYPGDVAVIKDKAILSSGAHPGTGDPIANC